MPVLPTFATRPTRSRCQAANPPRLSPWPAHLITLAVLLLAYAAGYSGGRDAAPLRRTTPLGLDTKAHHNHFACHPNLKP